MMAVGLGMWPQKPGELSNYAVGFECQDLTGRNVSSTALDFGNTPEQCLRMDIATLSRSQKTLMASLVTIKFLQPRTFLLENVGECPAAKLRDYIADYLPEYAVWGNQTDAADLGATPTAFD